VATQRLCERDVGAVIRRDGVPKLPDARHEVVMSVPVYDERGAVVESLLRTSGADIG